MHYPWYLPTQSKAKESPAPATLVCTERQWDSLRNHLIQPDGAERAAFMLLGRAVVQNATKYFVHRLMRVADGDCAQQHQALVEPTPESVLNSFRAYSKTTAAAFLHAHSHPFTSFAGFSGTDNHYLSEEIESLANYLRMANADRPCRFARIVAGQEEVGFTGEVYDPRAQLRERITEVQVVGRSGIRRITCQALQHVSPVQSTPSSLTDTDRERLNRNLNWLGERGQSRIIATHIALCGLGGLGAEILKNCRGLGSKHYTLIDMDRVESSNLNRFFYSAADVGRYKVDVARDFVLAAVPDATVAALTAPVEDPTAQDALLSADLIVNALDDDNARLSVQVLAARHLKPLLDLGAGIMLKPGTRQVTAMGGQATFYIPGEACLVCQGLDPSRIVPKEVRELQRAVGYVQGTEETPVSVVTINSVIGGIAGDIITKYLSGFSSVPTWAGYDLLEHKTQTLSFSRRDDCPVCGEDGIEGLGVQEEQPLPAPRPPKRLFALPKRVLDDTKAAPSVTPDAGPNTPEHSDVQNAAIMKAADDEERAAIPGTLEAGATDPFASTASQTRPRNWRFVSCFFSKGARFNRRS